ncbi:5-formyltetrahydrofolate cyclo-ligase [Neisseria iguanae]|uniref:5-formyltetrahydrofolate cyclo-ligase n=1 Tax=Neisseria iguanae TaxID=90242 RepID=A0A2P7U2Q9_9NEIS|nr:5-formyltetrahydrofolate cyclo-ligase [Neisseria iguanae]PSJ81260.1 5-formyltetrahydrofolate cyclo-ligase [Neisseria iguanae]
MPVDKTEWRRTLRRARAQMNPAERAAATQIINRLLKRHIRKGRHIGVYWPIGRELRLDDFIQTALKRGAKLYLPYIEPNARRLWFTRYYLTGKAQQPERKRGKPKLSIPQFDGQKRRAHRLDLLLVPVVGIDKRGYRLGQAGGFYDATLAQIKYRLPTKTMGVGFGCQLVDELPVEPHDIALAGFVSEQGELKF